MTPKCYINQATVLSRILAPCFVLLFFRIHIILKDINASALLVTAFYFWALVLFRKPRLCRGDLRSLTDTEISW